MERYEAVFLPTFRACLKDHPDLKQRVRWFVERLQVDPYTTGHSHTLTSKKGIDLRGKRGAHVSGNFVVVFMVCEECINRGFRAAGYNQCEPCPEAPVKRMLLLAFGPHKEAYGHTWSA